MSLTKIDPAPRQYPAAVHLKKRSARGAACAPESCTFEELEEWLVSDAINEPDMLHLAESLAWRMVAAGLPLDRATIHVGTLHPQLIGFSWSWNRWDGLCDEIVVEEISTQTEAYLKSPIRAVIECGESVVIDTSADGIENTYPIAAELKDNGIAHYMALPLPKRVGARRFDAVTIATRDANGFSARQQQQLTRILRLLALHVQRHVILQIAENVMGVYLGTGAGREVLQGSIQRGSGQAIKAVIWFADMRSFTELSEKHTGPEVNLLLNAYFEHLVNAVTANGGEVLKFMGDGLLAVFPFEDAAHLPQAAGAAMSAADQALRNLAALNAQPPADLARIQDWQPIRAGIAIHEGEVFFGNVGGVARLDFTVIGRAVNEAARLEQLTKKLLRPVLVSGEIAHALDCRLDDMGNHQLKGLTEPVRVFAPHHLRSSAIIA